MRFIKAATRGRQRGDGFIEIVIALALIAFLGTGITTFTVLTISQTGKSTNHMQAILQLENIGYWVSRDVQMAQTVTPGPNAGFPLQLSWNDTDNNAFQVTFSLSGGNIQRSLVKNGGGQQDVLVAQLINSSPSLTSCNYNNGLLVFNATATVGNWSLSRTFQIKKRPG